MSSVSSTSSSTSSLQGFGGLVSGLDRDSLIEAMTATTQNKITTAEQKTQTLEWKQEALQNISDKVIDLEDDYLSYSGTKSVKSSSLYAKSVVTAKGDEDATKYITASGTSSMTSYIQVKAVTQLATASSVVSSQKGGNTAITTSINADNLEEATWSNLKGKSLTFGVYDSVNKKFNTTRTYTFPTSYTYTDENNVQQTKTIDYENLSPEELVTELNKALEQNPVYLTKDTTATDAKDYALKFAYDEASGNITIDGKSNGLSIKGTSSALSALGFNNEIGEVKGSATEGYSITDYNNSVTNENADKYTDTGFRKVSQLDLLNTSEFTITLGGDSQTLTLLSDEDKAEIDALSDGAEKMDKLVEKLNSTLKTAFGTTSASDGSGTVNKVAAQLDESGNLQFITNDSKNALTMTTANSSARSAMGITENASTKLSMSASIYANREKLFGTDAVNWDEDTLNEALSDFKINGKSISVDANTSINSLLSKINNADAGVRASYMSTSGKFVMISTNTGSGREISMSDSASAIFGNKDDANNGFVDGKDAELVYDYGNGVTETITSSSNTFNIDGLKITASGTFGTDASGNIDSSQTVTFSAAANVDKAVETVKAFIEAYNEIVTAVNDQVTTRPASGYDPLTDDQKDEMTESEIEKWETKAKEGILYNESSVRNMSNSLQSVMSTMMGELNKMGLSYKDMEEIGITMSSDVYDGGKIEFDEDTFRTAMESDPEKVSKVMTGSNGAQGLSNIIESTLTRYATRYSSRNNGSYGELVVAGGSSKLSTTKLNNTIYTQLKENEEYIERLKELLETEQDRYISQFTSLETSISNMNNQSSYISSLSG